MESECKLCVHCVDLQASLVEKEKEIQRLKLHIQNLTKFLRINSGTKLDFNFEAHLVDEKEIGDTKVIDKSISFSDLIDLSCDILNINKHVIFESKSVQTEVIEQQMDFKSITEENNKNSQIKDGNVYDYVYDKKYQMYYNSSTGYYYDEKSGLMYEPQSCTYYKYNYDKKEYEKVSNQGSLNSEAISGYMCEDVLDQVNNLNLNDESINVKKSEERIQNITSIISGSSINDNEDPSTADFEKTEKTEVSVGSAKDWQPTEGSKLTVTDMVKQVVDEHNNMSDYIYDETYQMYYSSSTGYFYDAVKKLLYDPSSGIYYFYDADKQSYEFYCQVDPNSSAEVKSSMHLDSVNMGLLKCRKMYWKKKLEQTDQSLDTLKSSENNNKENAEELDEFSSPEDGEIFSSDDDSSPIVYIARSPVKESHLNNQGDDSCPPSIRAIVENSESLQIGSLVLITCSGGIIGRDKASAVHLPDLCVSKSHAEIKYNVEFQTYCIEDLGSQNGTFVNEKRLSEPKVKSEPCTLKHGDKLSLGSCKLLLHIHEGYDTCDNCEPGQVLAEMSANAAQAVAYMTKEEREQQRREELRRLKKKYGLQGAAFERKTTAIPQGYEDKAEIRRQTVGSDNPYEKTQEASIDIIMPETNKGYQMLKKMGWKEGQTLGTTDSGLMEPIPLRPWTSKAGLGSSSSTFSVASNPEDSRSKRWVKAQERYFQLSLGNDPS